MARYVLWVGWYAGIVLGFEALAALTLGLWSALVDLPQVVSFLAAFLCAVLFRPAPSFLDAYVIVPVGSLVFLALLLLTTSPCTSQCVFGDYGRYVAIALGVFFVMVTGVGGFLAGVAVRRRALSRVRDVE